MRTMTHKPKIGISLRVVQAPNYDEKRDALSQDWSSLLEELGFIPVFIPNTLSSLENFLEEISLDGLVLSGGDNIGENQGRDETENKLLMYAIEKKIPVIGVCRGMQLINAYFGGKLSIDDSTIHLAKKHNIEIFQCSQTDKHFLEEIIKKYNFFDIVIDDGSHNPKDVIRSFELLFSALNFNGMYFIEDMQTSYNHYYGGNAFDLKYANSHMNFFKHLECNPKLSFTKYFNFFITIRLLPKKIIRGEA